jgi:FG-GAP-like repeat
VLRLGDAGFEAAGLPEVHGRTSGSVFADVDADGSVDLVAARIPREGARADTPTTVFANPGNGALEPIADNEIDASLSGRSIGVLDFDNDNLLDLFVVEDAYECGSSRLYLNLGNLQFQDVTQAPGLPLDVGGPGWPRATRTSMGGPICPCWLDLVHDGVGRRRPRTGGVPPKWRGRRWHSPLRRQWAWATVSAG